ncbi:MAG: ABC transporter permease subunit, partial [Stellaceae bacterium]
MLAYALRRILLMIPTLFAIIVVNFFIIQAAPGGPVDQMIAQLKGRGDVTGRVTNGGGETAKTAGVSRASRGIDPALLERLNKLYGFDKPPLERFWIMIRQYVSFDFGTSFFRDRPVIKLIEDKLPVSISLGLWTTFIVYFISIPLGIAKATRDGSPFDVWTSAVVIVGYAIPGFLFAILLIVLFAGGSYFHWFPLRGLVSDDWSELGLAAKIVDYFWHIALPVLALVIGGFASLTMLT